MRRFCVVPHTKVNSYAALEYPIAMVIPSLDGIRLVARRLRLLFCLSCIAAVLTVTACNVPGDTTGQAPPDATPAHRAPLNSAWQTGLPEGGSIGNVAPNAPVILPSGESITVQELAEGKPLLLYYFATW